MSYVPFLLTFTMTPLYHLSRPRKLHSINSPFTNLDCSSSAAFAFAFAFDSETCFLIYFASTCFSISNLGLANDVTKSPF